MSSNASASDGSLIVASNHNKSHTKMSTMNKMHYTVCMYVLFMYRIAQNFDRGNFDGYWLFKYLMENILTDGYCLSPYTCKFCTVFTQFNGLNFDSLAGKGQKCQNFPHQNFPIWLISYQCFMYTIMCTPSSKLTGWRRLSSN